MVGWDNPSGCSRSHPQHDPSGESINIETMRKPDRVGQGGEHRRHGCGLVLVDRTLMERGAAHVRQFHAHLHVSIIH